MFELADVSRKLGRLAVLQRLIPVIAEFLRPAEYTFDAIHLCQRDFILQRVVHEIPGNEISERSIEALSMRWPR